MKKVNLDNLPIIDITQDNFKEQWPHLLKSIQSSTFIALDIEMSGLGNRKNLNLKSIEERYKIICDLANTYSILSLGVSCFIIDPILNTNTQDIEVTNKTYNILTLCIDEFLVEPRSLKFLIEHGFDFNKQFKSGIDYYKGNDRTDKECNIGTKCSLRNLITEISASKIPVVLHNGFIDLIFIYQNFYAKCPLSSTKFLADVEEIFGGGLYDTKYIADYHAHSSASFLDYLYQKALYENSQMKSNIQKKYVDLKFDFDSSSLADFEKFICKKEEIPADISIKKLICNTYSVYGYCPVIESCKKSHDINLIIHAELNSGQKKKKNKEHLMNIENCTENVEKSEDIVDNTESNKKVNHSHSAGLDAFMTGYVMLNYINKFTKFNKIENEEELEVNNVSKVLHFYEIEKLESSFKNNISLAGKDYPLVVSKSNFTSISTNHKEKKERLLNKF